MGTPETLRKSISWLKNNLIFIILFILFFIYVGEKLNGFESIITESIISESIIQKNYILDFQNKSGVARINSSFTDILIASDGSVKKGDGYELKLKIINPSAITLRNIRCEFSYSSSRTPVIFEDINMFIPPGYSKIVTCFISDLSDSDLKSISVSAHFDQLSFY